MIHVSTLYRRLSPSRKTQQLHVVYAYEAFKSHQLISSASVFAEATLDMRDKLVFFQVPDQSVIDHTLGYFTETTRECYRAVAAWISFIFISLWYW